MDRGTSQDGSGAPRLMAWLLVGTLALAGAPAFAKSGDSGGDLTGSFDAPATVDAPATAVEPAPEANGSPGAASRPSATLSANDMIGIRDALQEAGYRAILRTGSVGQTVVESATSGWAFGVQPEGCGDGDCETLRFAAGFIIDSITASEWHKRLDNWSNAALHENRPFNQCPNGLKIFLVGQNSVRASFNYRCCRL